MPAAAATFNRRAPARTSSTWDVETRTFEAVVSRFADVERFGYIERLSGEAKDWDFSRVKSPAGVPFLDNHQVYGNSSAKLGRVLAMRVTDGSVVATIKLGRSAAAEKIAGDLEDGTGVAISFQYSVGAWERASMKDADAPEIRIARNIQVLEVSAVNVAADPAAHVRNLSLKGTPVMDPEDLETIEDDETRTRSAPRPVRTRDAMSPTEVATAAAMCRRHNMPEDFLSRAIAENLTLNQVRSSVLEHLEGEHARTRISPRSGSGLHNDETRDNPEALGHAISGALYARMRGVRADGLAGELQGATMIDLGREMLLARGEKPAWSRSAVLNQIMQRSAGMHTISDFPILLASAGNRVMLDVYQAAQSPLKLLARRRDAMDFRSISLVRLSEAPSLNEVGEGGEVKYGTRSEAKEAFQVSTFATIFSISRNALINDDLGAFSDTASIWGQAGATKEAELLAAVLTANSNAGDNLDDGNPIFTTARGNKAAAGTVIDVTNLGAARKAMRETKGLDGKTYINLTPKYLLVGASKETEAEQVLANLSAAVVDEVNPFAGKLTLAVEPRLTGNAWRLFADPSQAEVLTYAYLNGSEGPQVVSRDGFDTMGMEFRLSLDFGCGATGWRGAFLNTGA